jgi:hypothetical protein
LLRYKTKHKTKFLPLPSLPSKSSKVFPTPENTHTWYCPSDFIAGSWLGQLVCQSIVYQRTHPFPQAHSPAMIFSLLQVKEVFCSQSNSTCCGGNVTLHIKIWGRKVKTCLFSSAT